MIALSGVTVSLNGRTILDDVNFQIKPGEFVFIVGSTGSGKSTLLRLMYMDLTPDKGSVRVGQMNSATIRQREKPFLRRELGIVFQDFRLLDDRSVHENVAFTLHVTGVPVKEIKKKVLHALADVGLSHQRNRSPHELSGGEQQRLAIARAIVNNPTFLLADEPTGNLDPETSLDILHLLKDINTRGTAVVMATHSMLLVRSMRERILRVGGGKVVEIGGGDKERGR